MTGGTPGNFDTGEWVGSTIFGNRTAGERGLYGSNINLVYSTPVQSNQGQVQGLEIDLTNDASSDPNNGLGIGLDLLSAGPYQPWAAQEILGNWQNGLIVNGYSSGNGIFVFGGQNQVVTQAGSASDSLPAIVVKNNAGTPETSIDNDGAVSINTTNPVAISMTNPTNQDLIYQSAATGFYSAHQFQTAGLARWELGKNNATESGGNAGSNFEVDRYSDSGTFIDSVLSINRNSGLVQALDGLQTNGNIKILGSAVNTNGVLLPAAALGNVSANGTGAGYVELVLTGATGTITGTTLSATCDSGTASVPGAVVGHPVAVSSTTGADVGGAFNVRGSVTSTGTVTVYVCGMGRPASLAYNVTVF